jgi:hypothetical protein
MDRLLCTKSHIILISREVHRVKEMMLVTLTLSHNLPTMERKKRHRNHGHSSLISLLAGQVQGVYWQKVLDCKVQTFNGISDILTSAVGQRYLLGKLEIMLASAFLWQGLSHSSSAKIKLKE